MRDSPPPPKSAFFDEYRWYPSKSWPRGGRGDRDTPVATAAEMVDIIWELPGTAEFRRNCAKLTVRFLGGDETLVDEIRANRAAQRVLAESNPTHPARIFGEAVENTPSETPGVLQTQQARQLRIQNDISELTMLAQLTEFVGGLGLPADTALTWSCRDRATNILRGGSTEGQNTIHAGLFLVQEKGLTASLVEKVRSTFGRLAAQIKRRHDGLARGAPLPTAVKDVNGNPTPVIVYRVPEELDILEEAYEALLQTDTYASAVALRRR